MHCRPFQQCISKKCQSFFKLCPGFTEDDGVESPLKTGGIPALVISTDKSKATASAVPNCWHSSIFQKLSRPEYSGFTIWSTDFDEPGVFPGDYHPLLLKLHFLLQVLLKGRSLHVTANKGPCQIIQQVRWTHSIKLFLEDLMSYANKRTTNGMWGAGSKTVSRLNPGFEWYLTKTNIFLDVQTRPILIWRLEALMLWPIREYK